MASMLCYVVRRAVGIVWGGISYLSTRKIIVVVIIITIIMPDDKVSE